VIGHIHGILRAKHPPLLLIDVHGIGYEVEAPMTTIYDLPALGEPVELHIHHVVREDAQLLYGFLREADRALFRTLIRISNVGPKLALAILSGMDHRQFSLCVHAGDVAALTRLPGVGKKTAERLIMEVRDRLDTLAGTPPVTGTAATTALQADDPVADAINALVALGYKPQEASRRINAVTAPGLACEDLIRQALRERNP